MKISFATLFLLLGFTVYCQRPKAPSISVHLEGGYGLSLPTEHHFTINSISGQESQESVPLRTAGGLQVAGALGIELRNNFRFMVHAHYQRGMLINMVNRVANSGLTVSYGEEPRTLQFSSFSISPLIHYRLVGISDSWYPYFNFGPSVFVWGQQDFTWEFYDGQQALNYRFEARGEMGLSLGVRSAFGLERKLSDKLYLHMAFQFRAAYLAPQNFNYYKIEEEGQDITDSFTISELHTDYVRDYNPNFSPRPSQPNRRPYSSIGFIGTDLILGFSYFLN